MTGTYRFSGPPIPNYPDQQRQRVRRKLYRTLGLGILWPLALIGLCTVGQMVTGCTSSSSCAYDPSCFESVAGEDFTDTGVGCTDNCLAPAEVN